jgi:SAM-dependent methyltransferase
MKISLELRAFKTRLLKQVIQSNIFNLRHALGSPEFRAVINGELPLFPLDRGPPMSIETSASQSERAAIWAHIASVWSGFGATDPYWSVLTDERWRLKNMSADARHATLDAFYDTGAGDRQRMDDWLTRNDITISRNAVCVEYGCGVGRVTRALARRFGRIIAFDISQPHIEAAERRLSGEGIGNVEFVLVRGPADLAKMAEADIFFSHIVLQHNPPPIIVDILDHAFAGLRPGGVAFFQVPTYADDYEFSIENYFSSELNQNNMEMHVVPQKTIFDLARHHAVFPCEIQPDEAIGKIDHWISTTFLFQKSKKIA